MSNNSPLSEALKDLGLNEKESKIYLALLELNESLPSSISRKSGVKRPTTYVVLEQLQKKGLVSHFKRGGNGYYRAIHPKLLLEGQRNKVHQLEEVLPELLNLHSRYSITPQLSIYEGAEGVIKIMEDTLTTSTELLCWANPDIAMGLLKDYYPSYIKRKVERKIWLKGIFCYDSIGINFKKRGGEELREVYLIPKDRFPFKNEINIYDDKVAIISHQDEIGVIIENKNIADTQRAIFNLGFEYARLLEKNLLSPEDKEYLGLKP
ncbi:MAG: helix-turn-helix domain-containing protein [Candidatus Gracilibacteria bacterium]